MSSSVSIGDSSYQKIIKLLKENRPIEVVGLGFGTWSTQGHTTISNFEPMINLDKSPVHFSIDYEVFYQYIIRYEKEGKELVGIFHSHPEYALVAPSVQDIHFMRHWPHPYIWLIGRGGSDPEVKVFALKEGEIIELPFEVI